MLHAASESDVAGIGPSSSSSPMAAYYVQSPSRDSHDEIDKCSSSNSHSPSRSPCSYQRHSMASSSSTAASRILGNQRRWSKHYCNVVSEEDGEDDDNYSEDGEYDSRLCRFLIVLLAFGMVFAGVCLVFWVASKPYKAQVKVKGLRVQNMFVGEGSDHTGVPTKMISVNCSANLAIYNPAPFSGVHAGLLAASLVYSQITVATGQMKKCYVQKKSTRIMWVRLIGKGVPLYGAGMALAAYDERSGGIPFKLEFEIQSRGYLVGNLVRTKHTIHASCLLLINPNNHTNEISLGPNSCRCI
ncbi:hypothetical protein OROGR_013648 [Orobanche gracilis]